MSHPADGRPSAHRPPHAAAALVASYRLQLDPDHGFDHAAGVLDHLVALGVSHLYLSPVAEAVPGSGHGYDVVDHTRLRAELGGADAFARLFDAAAVRGLRVVIDHVPNHASTARPELNAPWWEMLRDGPDSSGARWFDVDWSGHDGRVVLPVLGAPLDEVVAAGDLMVVPATPVAVENEIVVDDGGRGDELLVHGGLRLPLAEGTARLPLTDLLERQHYRLVWWRDPARNVRRFFTIDDLVAVCAEHDDVAATLDVIPASVASHPGFGGVRVDHVDGLADPAGYLVGLRDRIGGDAWLVVEKILAADETLPADWPVDGTTGYEFARLLDQVMVVPDAVATFDRMWMAVAGDDDRLVGGFREIEDRSRREVLDGGLRPDLDRAVSAAARALGDLDGLAEVLTELTVRLPRYRTYLPDDPAGEQVLVGVVDDVVSARPDLAATCRRVHGALVDPADDAEVALRTRWQQLTGPGMAKGAEDRAFYRYLRFASLCEVGGEPGRFGADLGEFHAAQVAVRRLHPRTMLASSTHDTKRSGDVRARAAALTASHADWAGVVGEWLADVLTTVAGIDAPMASLALQTAVTCPDLTPGRLAAFLVKSAKEADLHTSWTAPDDRYEAALDVLASVVVGDHDVARAVATWATRLDRPGRAASVAATAVRHTAPGVPDVYQGTEAFSYRLVDPDNRDAPDWDALATLVRSAADLDGPTAWRHHPEASKAVVILRTSALRRRQPEAFAARGAYRPLEATGRGADRVLAYARGDDVVVAVPLPGLDAGGASLTLELPDGRWTDVLVDDDTPHHGTLDLAATFAAFPAVVLERRR